jgi:hypothetical protein
LRGCAGVPIAQHGVEVFDADESVARRIAQQRVARRDVLIPIAEDDVQVGDADEAVVVEVADECADDFAEQLQDK